MDHLFVDLCVGFTAFPGYLTWSLGGGEEEIARVGFEISGSTETFYFGVGIYQAGPFGDPAYGIAKGTGSSFSSCPVHWSVRVR
jgi:hypothetical protein